MIIVTSNEVPGYAIEAVLGEVMGMTVRSANFGANFVAGFRSLGGGEVTEYTQLVYESRNEVMNRMWHEAQRRGGNAIIAMRFDTGDIAQQFTEICAYGTAVVVRPLADGEPGATPQSIQQAGARPLQSAAPPPPPQGPPQATAPHPGPGPGGPGPGGPGPGSPGGPGPGGPGPGGPGPGGPGPGGPGPGGPGGPGPGAPGPGGPGSAGPPAPQPSGPQPPEPRPDVHGYSPQVPPPQSHGG